MADKYLMRYVALQATVNYGYLGKLIDEINEKIGCGKCCKPCFMFSYYYCESCRMITCLDCHKKEKDIHFYKDKTCWYCCHNKLILVDKFPDRYDTST